MVQHYSPYRIKKEIIRRGFYEKLYANKFEYLDEINKFIQNTALITDKKKIWKFHIYERIESVTKNSS